MHRAVIIFTRVRIYKNIVKQQILLFQLLYSKSLPIHLMYHLVDNYSSYHQMNAPHTQPLSMPSPSRTSWPIRTSSPGRMSGPSRVSQSRSYVLIRGRRARYNHLNISCCLLNWTNLLAAWLAKNHRYVLIKTMDFI